MLRMDVEGLELLLAEGVAGAEVQRLYMGGPLIPEVPTTRLGWSL